GAVKGAVTGPSFAMSSSRGPPKDMTEVRLTPEERQVVVDSIVVPGHVLEVKNPRDIFESVGVPKDLNSHQKSPQHAGLSAIDKASWVLLPLLKASPSHPLAPETLEHVMYSILRGWVKNLHWNWWLFWPKTSSRANNYPRILEMLQIIDDAIGEDSQEAAVVPEDDAAAERDESGEIMDAWGIQQPESIEEKLRAKRKAVLLDLQDKQVQIEDSDEEPAPDADPGEQLVAAHGEAPEALVPAAPLPVAPEAARAAATADAVAYVPRPESADAARPHIYIYIYILQTLNPERTLHLQPYKP
ncbi:unnamed protein product, partial [Symbiodinium sp. CCMP2456]